VFLPDCFSDSIAVSSVFIFFIAAIASISRTRIRKEMVVLTWKLPNEELTL
jgi:hypothetical protein